MSTVVARALALVGAASLLAAATSAAPPRAQGQDPRIAVIVHPDNPMTDLSGAEVVSLFTAHRRHWPNRQRVVAFNLPAGSPVRTSFDHEVLGFDEGGAARYWIDRRVRGGDRPPRTLSSPRLMLRVVARLPGAVGYVPAETVDESVKVVAWIGERGL